MNILDQNNNTPNVLHFHGQNIVQLPQTFNNILSNHEVNTDYDKSRLDIVSCWTDDDKCCLLRQCRKFDIDLHNAVPDDYDRTQEWYMPNKIIFFIQYLKNCDKEIVMFLDGYDVLLTQLNDVIEKFEHTHYRILFGPSCNNYPETNVDKVYARAKKGTYRYFNAGCCIGYREDLLRFYKESLAYINVVNPWDSEQYVMRHAWAKYSMDRNQQFIMVDWEGTIFKSMGVTDSRLDQDTILFSINRKPKYQYITFNAFIKKNPDDMCVIYDVGDDISAAKAFLKILDIDKVFCASSSSQKDKQVLKSTCNMYGVKIEMV